MKKIIVGLEKDRQVYMFVVLGIILILFPDHVGSAAPYLLGIACLVYGVLSVVISLKYPESSPNLGSGVIRIVAGAILLFQKANSIQIIGVIWAMNSLLEVEEEINEYHRKKEIRPIQLVGILVTIALAVMLMIDPFEHFNTHVRILGLEMIAAVFVRNKKLRDEKGVEYFDEESKETT